MIKCNNIVLVELEQQTENLLAVNSNLGCPFYKGFRVFYVDSVEKVYYNKKRFTMKQFIEKLYCYF